jgi:multiple sugar transport system ATP-binding protein
MRVEISKLHQRLATTIIYVTHDQTEAMTLGTRIVVLKDGIIQQVDTPQNLYNTPNNLFVAGFMGSPQMNLIDAKVIDKGEKVSLQLGDDVTITLSAEKSKKIIDGGYVGKTVAVGIRPEDIKSDEEFVVANPDTAFETQVKVYELLGAEVNLHYEVAGQTCTAKANPRTTARPGDMVKFAMDIARLHVFDKETEQVITH